MKQTSLTLIEVRKGAQEKPSGSAAEDLIQRAVTAWLVARLSTPHK
ncbi:hypothetical protein [uncultured Oscillibacter sp.]|nr:hypothetical protein [uncultured Oscillibacter sp.]